MRVTYGCPHTLKLPMTLSNSDLNIREWAILKKELLIIFGQLVRVIN